MNIDIENLTQNITDDNPVGDDIKSDPSPNSLFYQIKDARNAARTIERKQLTQETEEDPLKHWEKVVNLGVTILSTHCKHLDVAVWLAEALVRFDGFRGLSLGFQLINALLKQYWENLYPNLDDEGAILRLASLTGLNGEEKEGSLIMPIRNILITQGDSPGPYALWQYQNALEYQHLAEDKLEQKQKQGLPILTDVYAAVRETEVGFYTELINDIEDAIYSYQEIIDFLVIQCAEQTPPSSMLNDAMSSFRQHVDFIINSVPEKFTDLLSEDSSAKDMKQLQSTNEALPVHISSVAQHSIEHNAQINSRNEALNYLVLVANYFRKAEPQSVVPYLIERTIKWGNLPLPELLKELIKDDKALTEIYALSGIVDKK